MKRITMILIATLTLTMLIHAQSKTTVQTTTSKQAAQPTSGNAQTGPVKKMQVTTQTLANLPAGKSYVIDLSRNGTIYYVAKGVDYSRIQVRTSTGKLESLTDLVKKAGIFPDLGGVLKDAANLILATASDLPILGKPLVEGYACPGGGIYACIDAGNHKKCWCGGN
jgi:hypothetical protein